MFKKSPHSRLDDSKPDSSRHKVRSFHLSFPPLMAAASNRDPKVERAAVEAMGRFRKANLVQEQAADVLATVIHGLHEGNDKHIPDLQRTACGALDSFGSLAEAAVGELAAALRSPIPDIRRAAAFTLAHIGRRANQPQATEGLLEALATGDKEVKQAAAFAIGKIQPSPTLAVPGLLVALDDANDQVRIDAQSALQTYTSDATAFPLLIDALKESSPRARPALAELIVQFAERSAPHPNQQTLNHLHKARDAVNSAISTGPTSDTSKSDLSISLNRIDNLLALKDPSIWSRAWKNHKIAVLISAAGCLYIAIFVFIATAGQRWWPLKLLAWNEKLESLGSKADINLPVWVLKVTVPLKYLVLIGFFHYSDRVLDAWVNDNLKDARKRFGEKHSVHIRRPWVSLPVEVQVDAEAVAIAELEPKVLRSACLENQWCLRILGEGGAGKTTLAHQLAFWAMEERHDARLSPNRPMLPLLFEAGIVGQGFKDPLSFRKAIATELYEMTRPEQPLQEQFVRHLLQRRRLIVILDGLSELDDDGLSWIREGFSFRDPAFLVPALIVTSRSDEFFVDIAHVDIRPLRIDSKHLLPFIGSYVAHAKIVLPDEDLFEGCKRLTLMAKNRGITPLLAKLYAEALIGYCKRGRQLQELPESVPELVLEYLNQLNRIKSESERDDATVHAAAKKIAWACVKDNFHPGRAKKSDLQGGGNGPVQHSGTLLYLEDKLRLIETLTPAKTHIQFVLDPLAEYLAAMYVVESCGSSNDRWSKFLETADSKTGAPTQIQEFLLAVCDCIRSLHVGPVSQVIMDGLLGRAGVSSALTAGAR